jgi:DUF971 family protein
MKSTPALVSNIKQVNNHSFTIEWTDGKIGTYRLNELQKRCPCANCNDEVTGKKLLDEKTVNSDVRAIRIASVGRYALRIQFTSGCSTGIYDFDMLHKMAKEQL